MSALIFFFLVVFLSTHAHAAPISVGGFTFAAGEEAFADDASLVSGVITGADEARIRTVLIGSNISDSFNTGDSDGGIVEVLFTDNVIVNGPGTDLVIFELSGDRPPGTPDPREIFGVSVFDGSSFPSFVTVTPIATGFSDRADPTLDVFAVQVDIRAFGIAPGASTDRVRLHIFNANLGTKSADLTAFGALNSGPVPEPGTLFLVAPGLAALLWRAGRQAAVQRNDRRAPASSIAGPGCSSRSLES
jgi:PEP-CTERM motif